MKSIAIGKSNWAFGSIKYPGKQKAYSFLAFITIVFAKYKRNTHLVNVRYFTDTKTRQEREQHYLEMAFLKLFVIRVFLAA